MPEKPSPPVASHPWIDFRLDLRSLDHRTWLALGECASKCRHIATTPLRPDLRRRLHEVYLAKGVRATTAIEGNTLSEEEVRQAVRQTLSLPPSREYLHQEVGNIIDACNLIGDRLAKGQVVNLCPSLLCEYNGLVLKDVPLSDEVEPGTFRRHVVTVGRYRAPEPQAVPMLVDRLCHWLGRDFDPLAGDLGAVAAAVLKAVVAHLYVAWIHPFGDGNGRTARLLEFDLLLRGSVPSPAAHLLSNHYNATRTEYTRQLDAASQRRDPRDFIAYAVSGFRDQLREQLADLTGQVRDIVWRNYVWELFREKANSAAARRKRHAVLDISRVEDGVPKRQVPTLTPRLQGAYNGKTVKTLSRDLGELLAMNLLEFRDGRYYANRSVVDAFLPLTVDPEA